MQRPKIARFVMAIASLVGFFASAYLFYTYVTGEPIACAVVSGCEAVRASKWAYTFGIPRPLLGLVFYFAVFALLVIRAAVSNRRRVLLLLTRTAAAVGFIESAFLFGVQWLDVRAFCLWCLISAAASTTLFTASFFDRQSSASERELRRLFSLLLIFFPIAAIALWRLITRR